MNATARGLAVQAGPTVIKQSHGAPTALFATPGHLPKKHAATVVYAARKSISRWPKYHGGIPPATQGSCEKEGAASFYLLCLRWPLWWGGGGASLQACKQPQSPAHSHPKPYRTVTYLYLLFNDKTTREYLIKYQHVEDICMG